MNTHLDALPCYVSAVGYEDAESTCPEASRGGEVVRLPEARAIRSGMSLFPAASSETPDVAIPRLREPSIGVVAPMSSPTYGLIDEIVALPAFDVTAVTSRLERTFEHLEPVLIERFPGPLWCDPRRPYAGTPRGHELSAIAACFVAMKTRAVPALVSLLESSRTDVRFLAAFVAQEMPYAPVVESLGRLALHDDPSARLAALTVLPSLARAPGYAVLLAGLRHASATAQARELRLRAVQALGELRDAHAVPMLVSFLRDADAGIRDAAREALRTITARVQCGLAWRRFVVRNAQRSRRAWLVDALGQWDADLRVLASIELARLTGGHEVLTPRSRRADVRALVARYGALSSEPTDFGALS